MPRSARRTALLRGGGFLLAAGLGVVGVWLIVTGNDSKNIRIGAIAAFWGLLLGTYAMFGARLPARAPEPREVAPPAPPPSRELDLRQVGEIERAAVAAARLEFQQELELMLRREMHDGFAREVASLRAEVNALRSDLVEKVGGQLRLERIETTRLIGSDLEAVQSELRKLRETAVEAEPPRVELAASHEIHEAEIVIDRIDPVAQPVVQPVASARCDARSRAGCRSGVRAAGRAHCGATVAARSRACEKCRAATIRPAADRRRGPVRGHAADLSVHRLRPRSARAGT